MELRKGTEVFTPNGDQVGEIDRVVINPRSKEVTHVVVRKGWLFPEDRVIPEELVAEATDEKITLTVNADELEELPPFEEEYFVDADEDIPNQRVSYSSSMIRPVYWYPPASITPSGYVNYGAVPPYITHVIRNIPEGTVPLQEGAAVVTEDGEHAGNIDEVMTDERTDRVSHLVISQGILFKERKLVPSDWITGVDEDKVHLGVSSKFLERLPAYKED